MLTLCVCQPHPAIRASSGECGATKSHGLDADYKLEYNAVCIHAALQPYAHDSATINTRSSSFPPSYTLTARHSITSRTASSDPRQRRGGLGRNTVGAFFFPLCRLAASVTRSASRAAAVSPNDTAIQPAWCTPLTERPRNAQSSTRSSSSVPPAPPNVTSTTPSCSTVPRSRTLVLRSQDRSSAAARARAGTEDEFGADANEGTSVSGRKPRV